VVGSIPPGTPTNVVLRMMFDVPASLILYLVPADPWRWLRLMLDSFGLLASTDGASRLRKEETKCRTHTKEARSWTRKVTG
jgi:hypothetical protein